MTPRRSRDPIRQLLVQARITSLLLAMEAELRKAWLSWNPVERRKQMRQMIDRAVAAATPTEGDAHE